MESTLWHLDTVQTSAARAYLENAVRAQEARPHPVLAGAFPIMVGDRASDVEAGRRVGCQTIFVDLGYVDEHPPAPDFIVSSLGEAAAVIVRQA